MSKNQLRKLRRREANRVRKLERDHTVVLQEIKSLRASVDYLCLELDRERGKKPFPPTDTLSGLQYWIGRSVYGS